MTKPYTTPTPNHILDNMHRMKPAVFKVCMAIVRQTVGYDAGNGDGTRREWDEISTSQFQTLTGLSNRAVIDAVKEAIEKGWIEREVDGNSFRYRIAPYEKSSQVIVKYEKSSQATYEKSSQSSDEVYEESSQVDAEIYEKSSYTKESIYNTPNGVSDKPTPAPPLADQFHALIGELRQTKNKAAVLREVYVLCFGEDGAPDYGYLGKTARTLGGAGHLAQRMFELVARPPNGDILAYILGEHRNRQNRNNGAGRESPVAHASWVELEAPLPDYMRG